MINTVKFLQLKSLNRLIISFLLVLGVTFVTVAPFSIVNAEGLSYYESNGETVYLGYKPYSNFTECSFASIDSVNIKLVILAESNWAESSSSARFFYFSSTQNARYYWDGGNGNLHSYTLSNWNSDDQIAWRIGTTDNSFAIRTGDFKINVVNGISSMSAQQIYNYVIENGIDNEPVFELGHIEDVKYSTSINSHGDDSVDTISWYPYFDSNNNPAVGWNAQIRVVPGYYYDSDRDSLMQQAFNLFHKEEDQARLIYDDHFIQGSFSISWGDVKNQVSITSWQDLFGNFVNILDGSYWYKRGWIYQIRIYDRENDLYSEWQDIYTVTSSSGEGVENIIDPSDGGGLPDYYNNVQNSFNTTSVVNNNFDVVYYYINTPVDTNPSSDDSNEYLKEIRNNVIQIRQLISIDNNANNTPNNDNNPWSGNPAAELYDFEDNSINDFNDAVNDLPTSDLVTGNKFLAASTWVRTQYETLVSNTPFEAVIIFSLLLGFGLLLIGKLR